jgi:hypothetical protein
MQVGKIFNTNRIFQNRRRLKYSSEKTRHKFCFYHRQIGDILHKFAQYDGKVNSVIEDLLVKLRCVLIRMA